MFTNYLSAEPQGSPVKMDIVEEAKPEPSPRKTKSTGEAKESPSKQRMARQKQSVKLKLEALMQKEPELTRRRPVRQASRKSFYSDALNLVLVGAVFTNWSSVQVLSFWPTNESVHEKLLCSSREYPYLSDGRFFFSKIPLSLWKFQLILNISLNVLVFENPPPQKNSNTFCIVWVEREDEKS